MEICLPSWQKPGSWLENCSALKPFAWVEGIELLFFGWNAEVRDEFLPELEGIRGLSSRFSFSLHLPSKLDPEAYNLVELTQDFVRLYVFHPWGEAEAARDFAAWVGLVQRLRGSFGRDRFAMEYTGEIPFRGALEALPDSLICADTGCLIRNGQDPLEWIQKRPASIGEIHLHAARGDKDHLALGAEDAWLPSLAKAARASNWRVVLETFDFAESRASHGAFLEGLL